MKFFIGDIPVYFPYTYIYPEQYKYMVKLKEALDSKGAIVLEMPSGTGKTVSLLSLITSYQLARPGTGKLIYCSRTIPEIEKTVEELRRVISYRDQELGARKVPFLGLALSARRNLCIHPEVRNEKDGKHVDSKCHDLTASYVVEARKQGNRMPVCEFYEGFETAGREHTLHGIYSLEDLREFGERKGWCPYFLARHLINHANVVVYSYQYIIDPKISDLISKEFAENSIVVFDEAHNIDNVCIEALSINLNRRILEGATANVAALANEIVSAKTRDAGRLQEEYNRLVSGLANTGIARLADQMRSTPVRADELPQEAVPGNIRRGEHFIGLMRRITDYLKLRLRVTAVEQANPLSFLQDLATKVMIDPKVLRFCATRLNSLLHSLQLQNWAQFSHISLVADFATLLGTYSKGFTILIEPYDERWPNISDPLLQFSCLDAAIAMKPVISKFKNVIITSGTISPLSIYPKMLDFQPLFAESLEMSMANRKCLCPLIVTRGSDQVAISSKFDIRNDPAVVRNYGSLVIEMSQVVPDGIVCFFTSYSYLENIVAVWNDMGIIKQILKYKLLFIETTDQIESSVALENYRKACDNGRGAVLFSVARGKVSEGIDFDNQYGRCVIMVGIPYMNTESKILRARLQYLQDIHQIQPAEFLTFDAMRTAAQCVGRVIRGKSDYGIMIFADRRYNRADKRTKLPRWIAQFMGEGSENVNVSTDAAVNISRKFLKEMAQPWTKEEQLGVALWTLEDVEAHQQHSAPNKTGPTAMEISSAGAK